MRPLIALAGGKSGGHVFPALSVAEEIRAQGGEVVFFGLTTGMEARLAREHSIEFIAIDAAALVGQGALGKLNALGKLAVNTLRARKHLARAGVVGILGTGGFVSAPTVLAGRLLRLPIVLLEPNAEPGAANRLLSRFASEAAVADESAARSLACRARVVGVPIRSIFAELGSAAAGAADTLTVLIVGGSQGAVALNRGVPAALAAAGEELRVIHQCGHGHLEETVTIWRQLLDGAEESGDEGGIRLTQPTRMTVDIAPFLAMDEALAVADLVVSRAGAITVAELSAAGRASILIPLRLADGHQLSNARRQESLGAAIVVEQDALEEIGSILEKLLADRSVLVQMGEAARGAARPGAAREVARRLMELTTQRGARWAA